MILTLFGSRAEWGSFSLLCVCMCMDVLENKIKSTFQSRFSCEPVYLCQAPGRVNLIGEHTDYNDGFVLPVAIDLVTYVAARPRTDRIIQVLSVGYGDDELIQINLDQLRLEMRGDWQDYLRAVLLSLREQYSAQLFGADITISSNIPSDAGLSSSASFCVALIKCFAELNHLDVDGFDAARIAQLAEHKYVGRHCGLMDPMSAALAQQGQAMLLDCRSLDRYYASLPSSHALLVIDSKIPRLQLEQEYNLRRQQCESAAEKMGVHSLREASLELLESFKANMSSAEWRRARHAISENARVPALFYALEECDMNSISFLMRESHLSMKHDYEVSVPEIDFLVDEVHKLVAGQGGVRMTGAGFGGCVLVLLPETMIAQVQSHIQKHYPLQCGLDADFYICHARGGSFS